MIVLLVALGAASIIAGLGAAALIQAGPQRLDPHRENHGRIRATRPVS